MAFSTKSASALKKHAKTNKDHFNQVWRPKKAVRRKQHSRAQPSCGAEQLARTQLARGPDSTARAAPEHAFHTVGGRAGAPAFTASCLVGSTVARPLAGKLSPPAQGNPTSALRGSRVIWKAERAAARNAASFVGSPALMRSSARARRASRPLLVARGARRAARTPRPARCDLTLR